MGGSDVGAGGHGRDVRGNGDENPRRSRAGAAGAHENDDRDVGVHHVLDDVPHRKVQSPRGVHLDDETLGPVPDRFLDGFLDVVGHRRSDGVVDLDEVNLLGLACLFLSGPGRGEDQERKAQENQSEEKTFPIHRNSLHPPVPESGDKSKLIILASYFLHVLPDLPLVVGVPEEVSGVEGGHELDAPVGVKPSPKG